MRKFENVRLPDVLDLIYVDGSMFKLDSPYRILWSDGGEEYRITVPEGYETDLSSIPRLARSIIPVVGRQNGPAVIHDYIYEPMDNDRPEGQHQLEGWTKYEADSLFLEGMVAAKVNWYRRNIMHAAVKYLGHNAWRTKAK